MPHPLRLELLRRALEGYRQHGRGCLVLRHDRNTVSYSTTGELEQLLANDEPAAEALLKRAADAMASYTPGPEAVVVNETPEGIFLLEISATDVVGVGEIIFSKVRKRPN